MAPDDDDFAPPPRSPIPAAIVASLFTTIVVFFALRVLEAKGVLPSMATAPRTELVAPSVPIEVPSLLAMTPAEARSALQTRGLSLSMRDERQGFDAAAGTVVEQTPLPHAQVTKGAVVQVVLSGAVTKVALSKLSGLKVDEALRQLAAQKLVAGPQKLVTQAVLPPGIVIDSEPSVGTLLAPESSVTLLVSAVAAPNPSLATLPPPSAVTAPAVPAVAAPLPASSPPGAGSRTGTPAPAPVASSAPSTATAEPVPRPLPRVTGLRLRAARELLEKQGFTVGKVRNVSDADRTSGVVLEQRPPGATTAAAGSAVELIVNN